MYSLGNAYNGTYEYLSKYHNIILSNSTYISNITN